MPLQGIGIMKLHRLGAGVFTVLAHLSCAVALAPVLFSGEPPLYPTQSGHYLAAVLYHQTTTSMTCRLSFYGSPPTAAGSFVLLSTLVACFRAQFHSEASPSIVKRPREPRKSNFFSCLRYAIKVDHFTQGQSN